jgi:transposase InsO family protein
LGDASEASAPTIVLEARSRILPSSRSLNQLYCPLSKRLAESFVKSFKRDYVYLADLWTAADVLRDLPRWFDDYNRVRPHKGLRMLSPVEFRNTQLAS